MEKSKLDMWKERLDRNSAAYQKKLDDMRRRDLQYAGNREIEAVTDNDKRKDGTARKTAHVWNITAENIDAIIDSSIPQPKVVALRKQDEDLARKIENMLRNELERLPIETLNDRAERTAKIQGAVALVTEWDSTLRTHTTVGENVLRVLHPRRIVPQDGVEDVEDMDYYFVRYTVTKGYIQKRYGVSVKDESEAAPELRDGESAEDMVTLEVAYYKNGEGGIGRFAWVGDVVCEDLHDCQARNLKRCKKCGMTEAEGAMALEEPLSPNGEMHPGETGKSRGGACAYCGSNSWESTVEEFREEKLEDLMHLGVRSEILAALMAKADEAGGIVRIPYYNPNKYPLVMQRNVTKEGDFLGESDCDKLRDHQNTMNRLQQKLLDRNFKAGSKIFLPSDAEIHTDAEDSSVLRITNKTDLALVQVKDFSGDLTWIFRHIEQVYSEAQRTTGVTESFLGRRDPSAMSGKAKEFSAAQTAGRLESRKVLKVQAWGEIFERIFKNMLAYADERRPIHFVTKEGHMDYDEFNPYEFLEMDAAGELYWNVQFLFTCDASSGLATNREAMWQECTAHFQAGAYGNPADVDTRIIYWTNLEALHYPGAGNTTMRLEAQRDVRQMQQDMMQQAMMQQYGRPEQGVPLQGQIPTV